MGNAIQRHTGRKENKMGHIKKLFSEMVVKPENDMNGTMFTIERAENFHLHWRNYRLVFNKQEFSHFLAGVTEAAQKWNAEGQPDASKDHAVETPPIYYLNRGVESIRAEPQKNDEWRKIGVELQDIAEWCNRDDFMHVHYKDLRIDLTVGEFTEFASVVEDGKNHLKKYAREKIGQADGTHILEIATEIHREGRGLAMVFNAEVDIDMLLDNWNSMYTKEQMLATEKCQALKESIKTGMNTPIRYAFVLANNTVFGALLDGHHRAVAAKGLGWTKMLVQFEIWVDKKEITSVDTIKRYLLEIFHDPTTVDKAFETNKLKLTSMEDLIW